MEEKNKKDKGIIINTINKVKKTKKTNIILIVLILMFITILILIQNGKLVEFDKAITNVITTIPNNLTNILEIITNTGGVKILPIIVIITFFILFCLKKRNYALLVLSNLVFSTVVYSLIKRVVQRPRPDPFRFIIETGYSFPSGHATNNMAFYGILIFLICTKMKNKILKIILTTICTLWILIMGVSRIYFNVHYPSDVIAGYILGIIIIIISINIFKRKQKI